MLNNGYKRAEKGDQQNLWIDFWNYGAAQGKKYLEGVWVLPDNHVSFLAMACVKKRWQRYQSAYTQIIATYDISSYQYGNNKMILKYLNHSCIAQQH